MEEWSQKYNPFNSMKALTHVEYWSQIVKNGVIPPPRFVSIDPCGICNYRCPHCNANEILKVHKQFMDSGLMGKIVKTLHKWKTRAACIGGGGESLLNNDTYELINRLCNVGIDAGVVSNGSIIKNVECLLKCKWVGFSVDAATSKTHSIMKGMPESEFEKVLENIKKLTRKNTEISYKYLLHPNNYSEIYEASKIAKDIGCNLIHIRPGADPWFNKESNSFSFTEDKIRRVREDVERARSDFEDSTFRIYGITHKFNPNFSVKKSFSKCYACFVTCVIDSRGMVGLCCDRRGDSKLDLCHIDLIDEFWGSKKHLEIHNQICVGACPRCTYSHINEIFENVIIEDKMMCDLY